MNIDFKSKLVKEKEQFSKKEISEAVQNCLGIWKDREDFVDFKDFRKQAWKGRDV